MRSFHADPILSEFRQKNPPASILENIERTYKKCISFKQKFTNKIRKNLFFSHDTPTHFYGHASYCIDRNKVYSFLNQYQRWYGEVHTLGLWNKVFNANTEFYDTSEFYRRRWDQLIQQPEALKRKADEIEVLQSNVLSSLLNGIDLISKLDEEVSTEYRTNGFEMSLYEREVEIAQMQDDCLLSDEEFCYVYTLECDLFVFYVGIAGDPNARFEQHIRGAFSDESHLFKSKFIQKFKNEIKLQIVFAGKRGDCKKFERAYIAMHSPLGNMTQGGEG